MAEFLIASLKHTHKDREHITFWAPDRRGYVLAITDERVGRYSAAEAAALNDGESCLAIPVEAVKALLSPMPYYGDSRGAVRPFYDTPGPVVNNTRANWNARIKASLTEGRKHKPKPEVFKGTRRGCALPAATAA